MRNLLRLGGGLILGAGFLLACAKVPITGRIQYNLVPSSLMRGIGKTTYGQMLSGEQVQRRGRDARILEQVGQRISLVADQPKYQWEYSLVEDEKINAWCLPGGYIAFYTAILPVLENEAGMAFVMGHEVGHAVAHHGAERVSQQLTLVGGLAGLYLYLDGSTELTDAQKGMVVAALGLGAEIGVMLPFSRKHESEADIIGMMYMAKAGYPPGEGIVMWDRMEEATADKAKVPAFVSTHPKHDKRQEVMREWLPQARKRYERNQLPYDTREPIW